jgi:hypothetical protein
MDELITMLKKIADKGLENDEALLRLIEAIIGRLEQLERRVNDLTPVTTDLKRPDLN